MSELTYHWNYMHTNFYFVLFHADPRLWKEADVGHWLCWATREFSLGSSSLPDLKMSGKEMCALPKEAFLARFPPFMGDILFEHLDILQKGEKEQGTVGFLLFNLTWSNAFMPVDRIGYSDCKYVLIN